MRAFSCHSVCIYMCNVSYYYIMEKQITLLTQSCLRILHVLYLYKLNVFIFVDPLWIVPP